MRQSKSELAQLTLVLNGAEASLPHTVLSFKLTLRASDIPAFSWSYDLLSGQK
ncbi:hypothetical protein ACNHUJ_000526 [Vibrio vulnificus]